MMICEKPLAKLWYNILTVVSPTSIDRDLGVIAINKLQSSVNMLREKEEKTMKEMHSIKRSAANMRLLKDTNGLKSQLMRARRCQKDLKQTRDQLDIMENNIFNICNGENNKSVLSTLQISATAMKEMGITNDLHKADQIISDLEEGLQSSYDINSTLGTYSSGMELGIDDDDIEKEFNLLMNNSDVESSAKIEISVPSSDNKMQPETKAEKEPSDVAYHDNTQPSGEIMQAM